ncbi:MAG: BatD family protein [Candidatus Poribacteria bacterium]|nr:BatD family protein [Candidatus Poribacteria bacterium]
MRIDYAKNYYRNSAKADIGVKKIGKLLLIFFIGIVFIFLATDAQSQEINVAAVVSPRHIQFGEKARLDLTISGETFIKHVEVPQFNFLPAFLAMPLRSETTPRLESNKIAVSMAWAYELIPQAVGDFALSDVRFAYQGNSYFANPGSIRVSGADTYVEVSTNAIHRVKAEVDTSQPYINAPFTYTFRHLYTTVLPTRESPTPRLPTFPDFFVEKLQKVPTYTQQIRGRTFWVEAYTHKLYPKKIGQIVLAPAELLLPLPRGHKTLKTKPLTLTVQPIPETGRPAHFNGAIGEYKISAEIERGWVDVGQALTLTVRISGHGNIQTVVPPKLPPIAGGTVSGPNLMENTTATSRIYAYVLTPARTGALRIPAIKYAYFDPSRAVYATTETTPIPLSVRPNPNDPIGDTDGSPWTLWVILFAVLFVVLAVGGYLWYRSKFVKPAKTQVSTLAGTNTLDSRGSRKQKVQPAEGDPITPVSHAREALAALARGDATDNATTFANALAQTLYQYLEDTLVLSERNMDTAREVCTQAQIAESVVEDLIDILTKCDYHRFAPVPLSSDERNSLITRAEGVINDIESHCSIAC